mgnify:FL=1
MMYLIIGGSGSGKSAYAEELLFSLPDAGKKYYIATMQVYDEESRRRVQKHRKQREGKRFYTIEQPVHVSGALTQMDAGKKSAMLECVSNLVANEMFAKDIYAEDMYADDPHVEDMHTDDCDVKETGLKKSKDCSAEAVADKIVDDIMKLHQPLQQLVIVSNNVFEDGVSYDEMTMEYIKTMGIVNQKLAAMADVVTEVVVGIPVMAKEPAVTAETRIKGEMLNCD